jgi:hypothetical protein
MNGTKEKAQRYVGYPKAVKAPQIPYKKSNDSNPVFAGTLLVIGAWLYVSLHAGRAWS